ncbi:hypothetical protein DFH27DRAFT_528522 [Peziza echinospora]|nr:hypothetical protein DFH27DRAFT_528522 [Peziza echinospora]
MAETTVLAELLHEVVPTWAARLEKYIPTEEAHKATIITPTSLSTALDGPVDQKMGGMVADSDVAQMTPDFPASPRILSMGSPAPENGKAAATQAALQDPVKILGATHGVSKMDSKPDLTKSRFSAIDGPVVYYDGESQKMLCDLWTAMNTKRGGLRKEMMGLKKRQQQPKVFSDFSVEPDVPDTKGGLITECESNVDVDEDFDGDTAGEMLLLKMKMEREKLKRMSRRAGAPMLGPGMGSLPFKRARTMDSAPPSAAQGGPKSKGADDEAFKTLLEAVDDNLDKACKVTETAAFVWLKGEVCEGHLRFILSKLRETAARIEKSGFVEEAKKKEEDEKKKAEGPAAAVVSKPAEITRRKSDATMRDAPVASSSLPPVVAEADDRSKESVVAASTGYVVPPESRFGIGMESTRDGKPLEVAAGNIGVGSPSHVVEVVL